MAAHILLLCDRDDGAAMADDLGERGYRVARAADARAAAQALSAAPPDVIVVSMADDQGAVAAARDLQSRAGARALPAIVIGGPGIEGGQSTGKLEIMERPVQDIELHNRLSALSRLVTMQDELIRRAQTARAYGLEGPDAVAPPADVGDARIMLIGAQGPVLDGARAALSQAATLSECPAPFHALESLLGGQFDAVVVVVDDDPGAAVDFCRDSRNNTRLYNLPIVLIADLDQFESPSAPFDAFASEVIARDTGGRQLADRVMHLVKLGRYRESIQAVYRSARHFTTADALTGLFSHGYLHAHLAKMIAAARGNGKPLSVGFFDIENMALINQTHGYVTGDRLLRQVGGMVGSLVRSEDLPARHGGNEFCIVLPDTAREAAEPVLRRIAGVINFTEFAIPTSEQTIAVNLRSGLAQVHEDDDGKAIIARARAGLREA